MFFKEKLEERIIRTDKKLTQLQGKLQDWEKRYHQILDDAGIELQEVHQYMSHCEQHSPELWHQIQQERQLLDEKLSLELSDIRDHKKLDRTYAENKNIAAHWLYVR